MRGPGAGRERSHAQHPVSVWVDPLPDDEVEVEVEVDEAGDACPPRDDSDDADV